MSNSTANESAALLRSTQIIVVALILGVVTFAVVAAVIGPFGQAFPPIALGLDAIELTAIAVSISMAAASFVVPPKILESARERSDLSRAEAFRTSRLIASAMCEGPALLWCVALLLSGKWWYLGPIALLIGLLVLHIPSRDAYETATGERVRGS
jgi:hypothetical protein